MKRAPGRYGVLAGLVGLMMSCDSGQAPESDAAARGKVTYMNICIACHAADPSENGVLGPPIANASMELLEAKVIRGEYPKGYVPKRAGSTMPNYAYVEAQLPDLQAFLAEAKR
ncbi:cytochrome c [Myxococcota bacterium]|nr:cytochrome c [Myxococcota bacterium]